MLRCLLQNIVKARLVLSLALLLLLLALSPLPLQAQGKSAFQLSVNPPLAYLTVKPGAGITHTVTLRNDGQYSLQVTPQLVDFRSDNLTGRAILEQSSSFPYLTIEGESSNWGKSFFLKPGQSQEITLVAALPSDVAGGEQHLSVLFQAKQMLGGNNPSDTLISGIVASNVVLLVSGDEQNHGQLGIADFQLPKFVDSFFGIKFAVLAKNSGSNATPITGQITIKHWPATDNTVYQFYPDMVLANSSRLVRAMTIEGLEQLENLEANKAVLEAAGQDWQGQKNRLIREQLSSQFYYRQAFLLGSYDFELQLGEEVVEKRVIALPFSILLLAIFLPILYLLFNKLQAQFEKMSKGGTERQKSAIK